jgi:hypothetical protein
MFYLLGQSALVFLIIIIGLPVWLFFGFTKIFAFFGLFLFFLYLIFSTVGTWRSSNKYADSKRSMIITKSALAFIDGYYLLMFIILFPYINQDYHYVPPF